MDFNRIEIVAPFVGGIGRNPVTGDRTGDADDGITLRVEGEGDRGSRRTGRARYLTGTGERFQIAFNSAALIRS